MPCDLSGRSVILGLGATGLSVATHIAAAGFEAVVVDDRSEPPGLERLRAAAPEMQVATGAFDTAWLEGATRVIVSPGLSLDTPIVAAAKARGLPLLGDIEIFAQTAAMPILAVTGSNGKSTVATLVSDLLAAHGLKAPAGGNLGPPALDLLDVADVDAYVLEISSFQMETTVSLAPLAAAVLNVSPDHLDRHSDLATYAALKEKLLAAAGTAVVNADDSLVREMASRHPNVILCSLDTPLDRGFGVVEKNGRPWLARDGEALIPCDELRLHGRHNWFNALAALALTSVLTDCDATVLDALCGFQGLPHRCQLVRERGGVAFVNDSKATNVGATVAALRGFPGPIVLIAGGAGKGADFAALAGALEGKAREAILIGESAASLARVLSSVCPVSIVADLDAAVCSAHRVAAPGDTVLLSPACASTDMFADYADRGRAFVAAVESLET